MRSKGVCCELTIAGDLYPGNPSSLSARDLIAISRVNGIELLGHQNDILPHLLNADVVVLPSYREGTPRILLEAASCSKPIVATDIAGCRGLVQNGVNGELVPPRNAKALARALEKLITDPELRTRYGRASREIVVNGFDQDSVNSATMGVYEGLK